jgi:ribonuclease HI
VPRSRGSGGDVNRPHDPGWETLWDSVGATRPAGDRPKTRANELASALGSAGDRSTGAARKSGGIDPPGSPGPAGLRTFIVRTDGAARGTPGPGALGAVLIDAALPGAARPDAAPLATISEYLGIQTNNVAEYTGVLRALALAEELRARAVDLLLDSNLIVEQLHGRWRVKDAKLIPLHAEAKARLARFDRWSARHVPRAQNKQADALCNQAIDRVQAGGPKVVVVRSD